MPVLLVALSELIVEESQVASRQAPGPNEARIAGPPRSPTTEFHPTPHAKRTGAAWEVNISDDAGVIGSLCGFSISAGRFMIRLRFWFRRKAILYSLLDLGA